MTQLNTTILQPKIFRDGIISIRVPEHENIKAKAIQAIQSMGVHSMVEEGRQDIANTDWHLHPQMPRPYLDTLLPVFQAHLSAVQQVLKYPNPLMFDGAWFQQYSKGGFHGWHTHGNCSFSNVYYLDLPSGASRTTFMYCGEEFEVDVAEGDILSFPSMYLHCSKPNQQDTKTVVAFNSSWMQQ